MIISDLNVLHAVEGSAVIGGGGFDVKNKFREDIDRKVKVDIDKDVKVRVDIKGNFADAFADAQAFGRNTVAESYAVTEVKEGKSSTSQSGSTSGTSGFSYKKY